MISEKGTVEAAKLAVIAQYPQAAESKLLVEHLTGDAKLAGEHLLTTAAPRKPSGGSTKRRANQFPLIRQSDAF